MKVLIDRDEWWPVYYIEDLHPLHNYGEEREVPNELIERWNKVKNEFDEVQKELRKLYKNETS